MKQLSFDALDFAVFAGGDLEERMTNIQTRIRPKLEALGERFAPFFAEELHEPFFYHVAKHARRTVNPPKDTWVAFAPNKRGYKMLPHFQIGLWETHVFLYFGLIYECPDKQAYAAGFLKHVEDIVTALPSHFVWSGDHMKPEAAPRSQEELREMIQRLGNVKKGELLAGIHIQRNEMVSMSDEQFVQTIEDVFTALLPLYSIPR
ncbi:YktB family protein [Ectobacillus ponti]|uniref:UPF0637 protein NK662_17380 n=1 Tax=Ectobacillus ponti TaxID=2961894 RepID=A0AA41X7R2_9BACI|nr:DUF1054 domain-containing protein [Ectobacillus ponti]MCP8970297.1 DUF1054 domain-containing protein [Ectobacillus ponti]